MAFEVVSSNVVHACMQCLPARLHACVQVCVRCNWSLRCHLFKVHKKNARKTKKLRKVQHQTNVETGICKVSHRVNSLQCFY
jgi:hypothetical protein